jgi:hypothetical protein
MPMTPSATAAPAIAMPRKLLTALALVGLAAFIALVLAQQLSASSPPAQHAAGPGWPQPAHDAVPAAGATIALPSVRLEYDARTGARLSGQVPDDHEHAALLQQAVAIYGRDRVHDELRSGSVANPAWLNARFLPDLRGTEHAVARLADGRLEVDAAVSDASVRQQIAQTLAAHTALGLEVVSRLQVGTGQR